MWKIVDGDNWISKRHLGKFVSFDSSLSFWIDRKEKKRKEDRNQSTMTDDMD